MLSGPRGTEEFPIMATVKTPKTEERKEYEKERKVEKKTFSLGEAIWQWHENILEYFSSDTFQHYNHKAHFKSKTSGNNRNVQSYK